MYADGTLRLRSGVRIGGTEFSLDVVDVGDGVSTLQVRDAAGAAKFEVARRVSTRARVGRRGGRRRQRAAAGRTRRRTCDRRARAPAGRRRRRPARSASAS